MSDSRCPYCGGCTSKTDRAFVRLQRGAILLSLATSLHKAYEWVGDLLNDLWP